jgi:hypothetical protein
VLAYERELRNVIAAVRGARQSHARVRVVHFATTAEINAALRQEPVHVLHLSGHGAPGLLELEDEDGNAQKVTADQFVTEAVPPGRMPPVIALAACHTDTAAESEDPSFAAEQCLEPVDEREGRIFPVISSGSQARPRLTRRSGRYDPCSP